MIEIRKASLDDAQRVFRLANDPLVRAVSFRKEPISWDEHWAWYQRAIVDPGLVFLLGFDTEAGPVGEDLVGQVRLKETADKSLLLSISLSAAHRARGVGRHLLAGSCAEARKILGPRTVIAEVKLDNEASKRFFSKLGGQSVITQDDQPRIVYTFSLDQLARCAE